MKIELCTQTPIKSAQSIDELGLKRWVGHEFIWADELVFDQALDLAEAEFPHLLTGELLQDEMNKREKRNGREKIQEDKKRREEEPKKRDEKKIRSQEESQGD